MREFLKRLLTTARIIFQIYLVGMAVFCIGFNLEEIGYVVAAGIVAHYLPSLILWILDPLFSKKQED